VMHARSGGTLEVMGMLLGKIDGENMIVMDSFALPVEGTGKEINLALSFPPVYSSLNVTNSVDFTFDTCLQRSRILQKNESFLPREIFGKTFPHSDSFQNFSSPARGA
jgi:JAB1/Mov34/MPN/PAD-1 ubiquitin protease